MTMMMMMEINDDDSDDDVHCTVMRRRCMLSSQPGTFSVNEFLTGVAKKKKKGKLKLEYSVIIINLKCCIR